MTVRTAKGSRRRGISYDGTMKIFVIALSLVATTVPAAAELPMGLKCDATIKFADAEIGVVGEYEIQKGMQKEKHTALLQRAKTKPVDGCHFANLTVGQTVVMRYTGPQVGSTEVQCIDLANNNAAVTFPKSIYTVRESRIPMHHLNPYCPDGKSKDGFPCSKPQSQSERGSEYKDKTLRHRGPDGNEGKNKLFVTDLVFDPSYRNSVPANAKLFCALINKSGEVVIAGSAQYPAAETK